jgi:Apea-like HEPN
MSSQNREDRVKIAFEAYVARCLDLLMRRCPAEGDTSLELGFARWLEDPRVAGRGGRYRMFSLTPDIWDPYLVCAARELAGIPSANLPEYQKLVEALQADPIIGPRLGNDVVGGAGLGGSGLQAETVASELVLDLTKQSGGFDPTPDLVRNTISRWLAHLRRTRESVIILAPLSEFDLAGEAIQVADGVLIGALTSLEIGAALMFGSWPVDDLEQRLVSMSRAPATVMIEQPFAIRLAYSAPVVRGGGTPEQVEATLQAQRDANDVVEEVVLALRLLKPGRIGLRGVVSLIQDDFGGVRPVSAGRSGFTRPLRGDRYQLAENDETALAGLYRELHAGAANPIIKAATRRFGLAADRGLPEDEIVDLVIAAESLFLGEINPPSERGEMVHRLATRAALFAADGGENRRPILKFMRRAYSARSGVVHSGQLPHKDLRNLSGQRATPDAVADDLEELVRRCVRKALQLQVSGSGFPPDWDELLFP